ncbi:MAG: class I SAM-dependent methyltransferase [Planctomycetaceae bacterium]|nr:class I SAM-dependent methyltransferase [Planctomycetaceae bacterium]
MTSRNSSVPRPEAWEDDISCNTLDTKPFENGAPVSDAPPAEVWRRGRSWPALEALGSEALVEMAGRDRYPIPAPVDREGYNAKSDINYWLSGLDDFVKVNQIAARYSVDPRSVLDFGCSSGRLLRHYAAQTEIPEIWGTDINARHTRWLAEFLPQRVKPIFNHCLPTLPIRDNSIDIITAFSVFTHIDTFETCWLAELARILRDGGLGYITIHNEDTWKLLAEEVDNAENRLVQSILKSDPDMARKLKQPMPPTRLTYRFTESGPYRAQVFHSNTYVNNVWGRFFKIESILPAYHHRQSVVILRRP